MKDKSQKDLLKIGELARLSGVSVSTIHYYVQKGLLIAPTKTSRNMAYYDPQAVQEIKLIQEFQTKRFLPLSVIKLILRAKQDGQNESHIVEMQSLFENIFQPIDRGSEPQNISLDDLMAASGISRSTLKDLEAKGLIKPAQTDHGSAYDDIDLSIAKIIKNLEEYGLKPNDLDVYCQYMDVIRTEFHVMHNFIHKLPDHEKISVIDLWKATTDLKGYLAMRIARQEIHHSHEHLGRHDEKA